MRGDSIRDLYAKCLALMVLGALAGTGALVDYWPVGLSTPAVGSPREALPLVGPIALADLNEPGPPLIAASAAVTRAARDLRSMVAASTSASAPAAVRHERALPIAPTDAVQLGPAVRLHAPAPASIVTVAQMSEPAGARSISETTAISDSASLEAVDHAPHVDLVPGSAAAGADEGDGPITGVFKKTGSSIVKTGAKTGASIFDVVRVVGGMVRRALPAD